jgi:hypothetical protein
MAPPKACSCPSSPVVVTWQLLVALGWTDGWLAVAAGATAWPPPSP